MYNRFQTQIGYFDTVLSTLPPSWISKKVLHKTYDVKDHVQS